MRRGCALINGTIHIHHVVVLGREKERTKTSEDRTVECAHAHAPSSNISGSANPLGRAGVRAPELPQFFAGETSF
jgi:hypothetical protein